MTPAHAHGQAGYCHLRTGDHTRARHHLRQSLQGLDYSREDALRNTLLATTYIRQPHPDLEKALSHANQSLTLLQGQVDSARCRGHLSQLTTALTPYRASQPVANFLDRTSSVLTSEHPRPAHR
ncbi:hypothetical protein [Actinocorallia sp. A-T 12471]|uniref:hypothetical protein n=1 Tax=Actinocorallia sp. A-T 12471 TaxID=3089813 RepID=UPI0029D09655|nr:hypothetical protein [Actinocorallia sp. A-T 12471]MDX6741944.1 hypothetical protein [Actinocorallia sp. A-T 12471]